MMNMKAMHKDFWMEIRKSKARFISIFMIVALGVAFFSGIQASSPDMRFSGDAYYDETNLMDIKVVGTLGLTEDDVAAIKQVDGVENAEGAYGTDVMCGEGEKQKVLHVEAVDQTMNRISVTEGKAPEKSGEIFLDCIFAESNGYKVGDQITLKEGGDSELLKKTDYTVVGLGESPLYISYNRGNSTLGSGEVNGFAYVLPEDFDQEVYTQIYVQAHGAQDLISYTDAYDSLIERVQEQVEGIEAERCQVRYDEIVEEANDKLADARQELEDGKRDAEKEIADGEKKIQDAQDEIDDISMPEWMVTDRNDLPEYSDYGDNADRMRSIGQVFPVIFFLVAALVSLTTMTRMVEEQRTQIGTMKALGYGKYAIASKYLLYAFLATVGGSILGILIGEKILPLVIINGYGIMYKGMMNNIQIRYEFKFAMIAAGAATVCTVGATIFSCYRALAETPASLMRPPAPKEGKRILLERIPLFWKHLNFTWKSTLRNLFRYKKRFFMTIFGISGSMALMLVGFGLRDSIMDIARRQYQELQHYTGTIIDDEDATDKERQELDEFLENNSQIERYTHVQFTKMSVPRNKSNISVYVYVPENLETFNKDVTLQDRKTKEKYKLTDAGTVISEKTATLTGLKVGDTMTITKDGKNYETKIAAVTENYMGHYIYMTGNVYEQIFGEKPDYSATVFTVKEEYKESESEVGNEILKHPAALSISYTSSLEAQLHRMLGALDTVIIVLIISAGMLAFVVLYNLNNVNITERQRELATLKVLGFYDTEVSAYVYRENVILTFIGVLAGAVFGIFLHRYIIRTVEVDAVMFGRNINPVSFLYCGLLTIGFSMIVNLFMHQKLKKIDMVESLKSVE